MQLALEQQRVEDASGVVAGHVADEAAVAGLGVDLDHGDVRAERERRRSGGSTSRSSAAAPCSGRGAGQVGPRRRHGRRARDVERAAAVSSTTSATSASSAFGGDAARACRPARRPLVDRGAAVLQRPRPDRAAADGHDVGVAP